MVSRLNPLQTMLLHKVNKKNIFEGRGFRGQSMFQTVSTTPPKGGQHKRSLMYTVC